ncbi:hypothetical protein VU05_02320 [Desulfobulbus sp. F1]|nr:hypothetical protein [Desulfobulbus sp. F1]
MNKLFSFATVVCSAVILNGCQPYTNSFPEYGQSSSTTVYKYTSYPNRSSSSIRTIQPEETWIEAPSTTSYTSPITYYPTTRYNSYTTNSYTTIPVYRPRQNRTRYYGDWYSGPAFTTPPMQPIPYPTEQYYPFKRPSPGIYVPWQQSSWQNSVMPRQSIYYPQQRITVPSSSYYYSTFPTTRISTPVYMGPTWWY